jgi:hypothetical protein
MPESTKCPICGGLWFEGECYKCGAYTDNGKVVVPKPAQPDPPIVPPISKPPAPVMDPPSRAWDEP